jgi:dihydrolipoamide dehydrogenase
MLAHTAEQEGFVAINKIMGNDFALEYESIPAVLYTDPSIVRVGVLPTKDTQYEVRQMPLSGNAKFRAMTDTGERGLCEAVIEKESGRIAGLHLISPNAEEISAVMALIVQKNLTVQDMKTIVFAHPTISEIIKETIFYGQIV